MTDKRVEVNLDGLVRLQSAAGEFARTEVSRIVQAVIENLRSRPASGIFGDNVAARHAWDEYCWTLQEGPFDDDMGWDDVSLGSISNAFDEMVRACVVTELEKLPKYALVFLSARAFNEDVDHNEDELLGSVWVEGIAGMVMEDLNGRAAQPNLDLIGPHRGDAIGYEIEGSGIVWSTLSKRGEAVDLVAGHTHTMLDPNADLSQLADEIITAFMAAAGEEAEGAAFELLDRFGDKIRSLINEEDVLPSLEEMRAKLLERLDGSTS
jgi:hypothetical protein